MFLFPSDSSIRSTSNVNMYPTENDSISETLLDKLNDLTASNCENGDRIISRIIINKDNIRNNDHRQNARKSSTSKTSAIDLDYMQSTDPCEGLTLGISIVQGSDNKVYVKDLVKNGPGARHGIQIGDQVSMNLPFAT